MSLHEVTSTLGDQRWFCPLTSLTLHDLRWKHAPWAMAASRLFSSGLSCSMVWMTGSSAWRSLPERRKMNCSSTFFRYSRLATDFSRSWLRSSRRTSLFRSCRESQSSDRRTGAEPPHQQLFPSAESCVNLGISDIKNADGNDKMRINSKNVHKNDALSWGGYNFFIR